MSRFAFKTLFSDRGKLLAAVIGVVFSLVLVNIQGGLYFGLMDRASLLINVADVDLWIGHRLVENVDLPKEIHVTQLSRIKGLSGVQKAEPYIVGRGTATLPDGGYEDVWIIGCDSATWLGAPNFIAGSEGDLVASDQISIDEQDRRKLGNADLGDVIEINGHRAKIAAKTDGMLGFMTTPNVFTNLDSARQYSQVPDGYCHYFLVTVADNVDIPQLAEQIRRQLPDLDVYTADQFRGISKDYWMKRTGIGISFGASTLMGLLVGLVMVGQSLYALALDHLSDYATLRAMGAEHASISQVVFVQALTVAMIGSVLGTGLVLAIRQTWNVSLAPIEIPLVLMMGGIVLVFCICLLGATLPLRRIRNVDPMMVLQG